MNIPPWTSVLLWVTFMLVVLPLALLLGIELGGATVEQVRQMVWP
jgi:hypothetical protein